MSIYRLPRPILLACLLALLVVPASAQQPQATSAATATQTTVAGATNFVSLDQNFASGGATTAEAFATLKQQGFRTVINLRTAAEPGADLEGEAATVRKLGLTYLSLPFTPSAPDAGAVDKFLEAVRNTANQPVYIHCASGARATAFWLIKRVLVDKWTIEKALAEADTLKLRNEVLRTYAVAYIGGHQ